MIEDKKEYNNGVLKIKLCACLMRYVRDAPVAERSGRPKLRSNEPQRGRKRPRVMRYTLSQGRTKRKSFGCSVRVHGKETFNG